jgi:hypothetical protein
MSTTGTTVQYATLVSAHLGYSENEKCINLFCRILYKWSVLIIPTLNTEKHKNTLSKTLPMLLKYPSKNCFDNIGKIILATKIALPP